MKNIVRQLRMERGWSQGELADQLEVSRQTINAIETEWSSTPLGWAAREGRKDMVAWLLSRGANPELPEDERWARPVEWARRRGHSEIVKLLGA